MKNWFYRHHQIKKVALIVLDCNAYNSYYFSFINHKRLNYIALYILGIVLNFKWITYNFYKLL